MYDLGRLQPDPASRAARQLLEVGIAALTTCVNETGRSDWDCCHGITQHKDCASALVAESWDVLQDAARYFQDVLMLSGEDEDVAAALDTCMADLEDVRSLS